MLDDLESILTLIRTDGIGPRGYIELISKFKTPKEAILQNPKNITFASIQDIHKEIEMVRKFKGQFITIHSPLYPQLLKEIPSPPIVLTVKGNIDLLKKTCVGIVGARNASSSGKTFTKKISNTLGEYGYAIVSGLARGIDTAAHSGALNTGTIAVIGNGINIFYPDENKVLQEEIFEKGLVVSEFPFNGSPQPSHFPQRNRIISGLSRGILVVEAAFKSGSLITAHTALDQGREVMAVPGSPLDPRCHGTNKLLKDGARLIETADDVLQAFGDTLQQKLEKPQEINQITKIPLESSKGCVLENLSYTPIPVDQMIIELGLPPKSVHAILLELELEEKIERHPGNKVALKTV